MTAPIAVTGARGRLGTAIVAALEAAGERHAAWSRPEYDLDDPGAAERAVVRDRPRLVIHTAAWVDVDGCARQPHLAHRRNAAAAEELARAVAAVDGDLVLISTNEVFDGLRTDRRGYAETDAPQPGNAYGSSKLDAERLVADRMAGSGGRLWIVRTSWLYGLAGGDFPSKILATANRGGPLRVVDDEWGCPTPSAELANQLLRITELPPGTYHLASREPVSRYGWAVDLLRRLSPRTEVVPIRSTEFERASTPPPWGVLDSSRAAALGLSVPNWSEKADRYSPPAD